MRGRLPPHVPDTRRHDRREGRELIARKLTDRHGRIHVMGLEDVPTRVAVFATAMNSLLRPQAWRLTPWGWTRDFWSLRLHMVKSEHHWVPQQYFWVVVDPEQRGAAVHHWIDLRYDHGIIGLRAADWIIEHGWPDGFVLRPVHTFAGNRKMRFREDG